MYALIALISAWAIYNFREYKHRERRIRELSRSLTPDALEVIKFCDAMQNRVSGIFGTYRTRCVAIYVAFRVEVNGSWRVVDDGCLKLYNGDVSIYPNTRGVVVKHRTGAKLEVRESATDNEVRRIVEEFLS